MAATVGRRNRARTQLWKEVPTSTVASEGQSQHCKTATSHQYGILLYQVLPLHSTGDPSPHSPVVEVRQTQKNQKSYKYGGTEQHREKVHRRSVTLAPLNVDSQIIKHYVRDNSELRLRNHFHSCHSIASGNPLHTCCCLCSYVRETSPIMISLIPKPRKCT